MDKTDALKNYYIYYPHFYGLMDNIKNGIDMRVELKAAAGALWTLPAFAVTPDVGFIA